LRCVFTLNSSAHSLRHGVPREAANFPGSVEAVWRPNVF
jgi:hypothetical protein